MKKNKQTVSVVINDDPVQLMVLSSLLNKAGYEAQAFSRAEAALRFMSAEKVPDVVVTDLYMPGIDGWKLCRLLRSPEYHRLNKIPIMVVSATFSGEAPDSIASDLGANGFLPSPVDGAEFVRAVDTLVQGRSFRPKQRILILEDSDSLRKILDNTFSTQGFETVALSRIVDAQKAIQASHFDLAIIDYHLPDGQGDQLLDCIHTRHPDCVVIMITTDPSPELALNWLKKGASAYIRKPFSLDYLLEVFAKARRERYLLRVEDILEKRTQELKSSQILQKTTIDALTDGIHVVDNALNIRLHNRKIKEWCREQNILDSIQGKSLPDIFPSLSGETFAQYRSVLKNGCPINTEEPMHMGKKTIHTRTQKLPIFEREKVTGVLTVITDISERIGAEKALHDKTALLQSVFDNGPNIIILINGNGKVREINRVGVSNSGREKERIIGLSYGQAINCAFAQGEQNCGESESCHSCSLRTQVLETLKTGKAFFEVRGKFKVGQECKGMLIEVLISTSIVEKGSETLVLATISDITKLFQAQQALLQNEERFRLLIKNSSDVLAVIDTEQRINFISPSIERITGFQTQDMVGKTFCDFIHPDDIDKVQDVWEETLKSKDRVFYVSFSHRCKQKGWVDFDAAGQNFIEDQSVKVIVISLRDVTEQKRIRRDRERLQELYIQAQKLESIGRLAGGVAHDFNNMLGVILGHLEMAISEVGRHHKTFHHLEAIQKAGLRSADLTKQLLAFARRQPICPKILNLNSIIEDMQKMLKRLVGEDISIVWKPKTNLWPVSMDSSQINQILANLCINARDAMSENGTITIATDNIHVNDLAAVETESPSHSDFVQIIVSDTGCGMDSSIVQNIFEPFFTTKPIGKGTGLGLATVYGIVNQNNGFIEVDSHIGRGTAFRIFIPRAASTREAEETDWIPRKLSHGEETILLVEDDPSILKIVRIMLKKMGYRLHFAATPKEALHLVHNLKEQINLLITDVVMPEMNGKTLAEKLTMQYRDLKVLYMSGYTADVIETHGILDGGLNFIQKPFTSTALAEAVRAVLDGETQTTYHQEAQTENG